MNLSELQERRMKLAHEIAEAISFEVCKPHVGGYFELDRVMSHSAWVRETYSFHPLPEEEESLLYTDLIELTRRGWIFLDTRTGKANAFWEHQYSPEPGKWTVGLHQEGLDAVEKYLKPWWKSAYEKQPVTAWQILVTIAIAGLTFWGGFAVGRGSTAHNTPTTMSSTGP